MGLETSIRWRIRRAESFIQVSLTQSVLSLICAMEMFTLFQMWVFFGLFFLSNIQKARERFSLLNHKNCAYRGCSIFKL